MQITFLTFDGVSYSVDVDEGMTAMEAAINQGIDGIAGDCGGNCNCATCHVFVDENWQKKVGEASPMEAALLAARSDLADNSRLACQIPMTEELDGLVLRMPESQFI
ncbi:MAG: 2Fe-2S iron-sulfur cluster binding domain-containing protein [Gammaproteobacteria bacterium]|nr:2Fe-2S iron-sulfur cluster binding domain-containing protein [Gammaproteobacteria bacterium]